MQIAITTDMTLTPVILATAALIVAIITLSKVSKQNELIRKQVFGEVYDQAQIKDLQFYLPERQKHIVDGFEQKEDSETYLGKTIRIPVGVESELHIRWTMAKSQTLRGFVIGFHKSSESKEKPEIIGVESPFVKKPYNLLPREKYIDWSGFYHCEYAHARKLMKDDCFVACLKVIGKQMGKYLLNVEVSVAEAPHPFKEDLEVEVK